MLFDKILGKKCVGLKQFRCKASAEAKFTWIMLSHSPKYAIPVQGERRSQVYLDYAEPQPVICNITIFFTRPGSVFDTVWAQNARMPRGEEGRRGQPSFLTVRGMQMHILTKRRKNTKKFPTAHAVSLFFFCMSCRLPHFFHVMVEGQIKC
ncbi:MAG: hypothetical protein PUD40_00495 [Bacteroidales bacterium]|nr:hypothetical protein [Bacteroidales bacterium]